MALRIFIFSIVLGAEYLSYLEAIETLARAFSRLISDGISGVSKALASAEYFSRLLIQTNIKVN